MPMEKMRGRILLAEDNVINQQVTATILHKAGYSVDIACDGYQAVNMWENNEYSLVLMDWHMPGMDGLDATRLIRSKETQDKYTNIIALTANATQDQESQVYDAGMDAYLSKPFQAKQLIKLVDQFIIQGEVSS